MIKLSATHVHLAGRGRELCGIVNSQFFYIFMLQQVSQTLDQMGSGVGYLSAIPGESSLFFVA